MNSNSVKILALGAILILVVFMVWLFNRKDNKANINEIFPGTDLAYTEEEAQNFYTKKIIKYLDIFKGNFFLKYSVESTDKNGKITKYNEEYSTDSGVISILEVEDYTRIIIKGETIYYVDIYNKTATKLNTNTALQQYVAGEYSKILFTSLERINTAFLNVGYEEINGARYYYEEYEISDSVAEKSRYYFDGDTLKFIKIFYKDGVVSLLTLQKIENETYDDAFIIPDDYTVIST